MRAAVSRESPYPGILSAVLARGFAARSDPGHFDSVVDLVLAAAPAEYAGQLYARSYLWRSESRRNGDVFVKTKARWSSVKLGFEEILASWPTDWNLNAYTKFACMAKDKATAKALFDRLEGRIIETRWDDWRAPRECAAWASAPD